MNLFASILTYTAPSANYRGESPDNRSVIQKITKGRHEYAIVSPEAMRNALRETLKKLGLPCNRERLSDEEQLAVKFQSYPDETQFADDFFMGWMIAASKADREKIKKEIVDSKRNADKFSFKRDSVLRMNMAVALEPYRHDSVFTQSPSQVDSPWKNADNSQLLHRETTVTAFQYPLALNLNDCAEKPEWTRVLLQAVGELNEVAGNHARSYFEMAPASIVIRLTNRLAAGFDTYGYSIADNGTHHFTEITAGIEKGDYPGSEFFIGGKIIKDMPEADVKMLKNAGVTCDRSAQTVLEKVADAAFPKQ